jgi:general secretion pathway protein H
MAQRGFTLIELLVVFAVMALVVIAVPVVFSGGFEGASLKQSVRALADELRRARSRAIARNMETGVAFDASSGHYRIFPGGSGGAVAEGAEISVTGFDGGTGGESGQRRIVFFPDGGSTGGRIKLARGGRDYEITVNWLTGRIVVGD